MLVMRTVRRFAVRVDVGIDPYGVNGSAIKFVGDDAHIVPLQEPPRRYGVGCSHRLPLRGSGRCGHRPLRILGKMYPVDGAFAGDS